MNPPPNLSPFDLTQAKQHLPSDFVWGVATSAYQIEGAAQADGKGDSIWDVFCRIDGAIADGTSGQDVCQHYRLWEQDLDLIASLGVDAYRFSVSWPRVQPLGYGAWNEAGLAFYERLVDGLVARGIKPFMTLNHWDLPQALQAQGGWANRNTVQHFVDYALKMHERLGQKVHAITTHNEPWIVAFLGHEYGIFAPGIKDRKMAMQVAHHLLLSHGMAQNALRKVGCKALLGIALNLAPAYPATPAQADVDKCRIEHGRLVRWFMDPLFKGTYPQDIIDHLGDDAPTIQAGDMAIIQSPMDYLGINYYTRMMLQSDKTWDVHTSGLPLTDMDWEIYPQGLIDLLTQLHTSYHLPPIYITENGGAFKDHWPTGQSRIQDDDRIDYLSTHIAAVARAMQAGVTVHGYMVWSLLDNFEWASGCAKRFGLVHVDYNTYVRTPKASALWYRDLVMQHKAQRSVAPQKPLNV